MTQATKNRLNRVRSILVSQPKPSDKRSPYFQLTEKYKIKIDFRPFIEVQPVSIKDFRKQKIEILKHTAVIFTSRNAIDHFFGICQELKIEMPADMKYFCISEQTAHYLQKYIVIRKRKLFVGTRTAADLFDFFKKHKSEKYLFPCSDIRKDDIPEFLSKNNIDFTEAIIYHTVAADLSDLKDIKYDILAFYSPSGIKSLFQNFPDFEQGKTRIAAFGPTTAQAVKDMNLIMDIEAPLPNAPSMTGALELYIKKANKI
ncbi:uroporphyrinogen-III synthase [Cyclobacterium sp. 1_MG-2023]|mgnify:FL=1|uniref:Uroporphyrinogen III synthase HEM4 n=1 Tax=Cyclobacterium marinum (strain ATCC 25205 / DSM 745 / LMG 13164 / NCIMB 1802) TaxID=880070 RepID=G0IX05_CYCMS|nr:MULTISPECIES: uroporphyrinogen-III synthase [Cyclobacterium]AEL24923.1 Uroporphyrinogen III synthase HEM4 [Cyclobacterium marinum DSM 745]MBI0401602.1 uroporphyrinogen-III synthase [Cyclobacterium marinum]MBR9773787.1 uroporphyrinogen-III synthase [Cytophagales bacterium]MDO6437750.1 uroporphyrinogen-III synthase [Cyclobacterium sp. 1_MG-2023]|tara:strand:+ start:50829 stop:51602 length:774 start_codon:yes stop_codon:yes gene_type:complete